MSIQRRIVQKLFESRGLSESSFESGGSTYKCAFGRYYKDGEEIDRDAYFKAKEKDGSSTSSNSSTSATEKTPTPEEVDSELDDLDDEIDELLDELRTTDYKYRGSIEDRLSVISKRLRDMESEDYVSDEQYERSQDILDKIPMDVDDVEYEEPEPDWDMMHGGHDDYDYDYDF